MGLVRGFGYATLRAFGNLWRRRLSTVLATVAIATSLLLVGVVRLADHNIAAASSQWAGGVQMVVYLDEATSAKHAEKISDVLRQLPAVQGVQYVPRDQALTRLRSTLSEHSEITAGIEPGMLPSSLEVRLSPGVRDVASAHPVVERLAATPGVEQVEFLGEWVDRFTGLLGGLRGASAAVLLLVVIACLFVTAATIRLSVRDRAQESRLADILGAGAGYVRGAALIEGTVLGATAGALAVVVLWFLFQGAAPSIEMTVGDALGSARLSFLPISHVATAIAGAALIGGAGAWFATGRRALG